jgi:aldoxime dehydratase
MKHTSALGPGARLQLYHHEVTVVRSAEQFFEYCGCHERTGLLKATDLTIADK